MSNFEIYKNNYLCMILDLSRKHLHHQILTFHDFLARFQSFLAASGTRSLQKRTKQLLETDL